jgi:hypothetical protein
MSCREPTQVTVEISTDIDCSDHPKTGISLGRRNEIETRPLSTETEQCNSKTGRIGSIVLIPDEDNGEEFGLRVVAGMTMSAEDCVANGYVGGCVVSRRVLSFVPHDHLYLPIRLEASCIDVPCNATQTCRSGSCVSATIPDSQACKNHAGCDVTTSTSSGGTSGVATGGATNGGWGGTSSSGGVATGGIAGSGGAVAWGGTTSTGGVATGGIAGSGGAVTLGGTSSTGGVSTTTGGSTVTNISPLCSSITTGSPPIKGGTCTSTDTQLCYWMCGPLSTGYKTETCVSGFFVEGECVFPTETDYSCFKVPTIDSPGCPTNQPQSGQPCSVTTCSLPCSRTVCSTCGVANGYLDSIGAWKDGYCVCVTGTNGNRWSCASKTAWPCPAGQGC